MSMSNTSSAVDVPKAAGTNVQVAIRCRPINGEEKRTNQPSCVTCEPESKSVKISYGQAGKKTIKSFNFDRVFGVYSRQSEVYDEMVRPIVDEVLEGFNCTIFAYGQTGTGKTHTMEGDIHSEEDAGIVPRSVRGILQSLESTGAEFTIRVSFLELYNEELQDLLNISGEKKLKLCEDVKKGVVCQNLEEITVLNEKDIFEILARGIQLRQTASTLCNAKSSRSHSIFTMKIMIKECNVEGEEVIRHGQLNLVDLAGSECVGRSGAKNDRLREAGSINQSLLTLGRVITALVDHHGHIPYRDSKLTRLLQESLGGKAKTCIIATLSPSQGAVEETMSTLDYAYRAKSIKNQPTLNQRLTKKVIMKEYLAEVENLKMQLMQTREKNGVYVDPAEYYTMETRLVAQENQITEAEGALQARTDEVKLLRRENIEAAEVVERVQGELQVCAGELTEAQEGQARAQAEVGVAYVELTASNQVVGEQVATERGLAHKGAGVQRDLKFAQKDVTRLLHKVSLLGASEARRLAQTESFVASLNGANEALLGQVKALGEESEAHRDTLQGGVSAMLSHGRDTCAALTGAIDEALNTMVGGAEAARDEMSRQCGGLKTHLQDTNTSIEGTLRGLQTQLSAWLGEVDSSMAAAQAQLCSQQAQLSALSQHMQAHFSEVSGMSRVHAEATRGATREAAERTEELRQDLESQLSQHRDSMQAAAGQAGLVMQQQADAMQLAVQSMLQDMVAHSSAAFRASAASTTHMASSASATLNAGLDALTSSQQDICLKVGQNADTLDLHLTQTGGAFTTQMQGVSTASQGADAVLSTVSGEVGAKRKFLDHTVGELAVEVGGAIETALGVVDSTSLTASQVLTDVSAASRAMQATASTSTDAFAAYMDCEGDLLCATLNTHFSALGGHVLTHIEGLGEMEESAQRHDWVISESAVPVTGSTPQKLSLTASQSPFKRTRAHREIKTAARGVGGVGYEEASRGIAEAGGAPGADEEEGEIEGEGQMEEEMVGEEMEASEEVEGGAEMAEEGEEEGRAISRFSEESASSASSKACKDPTAPTAPTSAPEEAQDENSPVSPNVPKKRRTTKIAGPSTRPSRSQSANLDI